MTTAYVHGYSAEEARRLSDQAETLTCLLHHDSVFPPGSSILEAGCGTGAQTCIIASMNPSCRFHSLDISEESLRVAKDRIKQAGLQNVTFMKADIRDIRTRDRKYDHAFFCFVLEHLQDPVSIIQRVMEQIKPGGSITVIEGDHGSVCFHPETKKAMRTIECLVILQSHAGGDACIGRRLYPLMNAAGLCQIRVSPRLVYADAGRPGMVSGFTRKTFIAMIEGVHDKAVSSGLMTEEDWNEGISDLNRSTEEGGTFSYTFYKAVGIIS